MKEENIVIEEEIFTDEIYEFDFTPTAPKPFDKACVYGVFIRDRLVYIGYTYKGF